VLRENVTMLEMCRELGFKIRSEPGNPDVFLVELRIRGK
jgi:hypothetical protein